MLTQQVTTNAYQDQKPGTSGLRKRVKVFQQKNYTENFVQAILSAIPGGAAGSTLVVGGDGRYYGKEAIGIIIRLAAGNKVSKLIIGQNGILSTPAASNLIRKRKATGGILLTASHNPGGPENDFGIKYNVSNGGPAPESITDNIFAIAKTISTYHTANVPDVDLAVCKTHDFDDFSVEVMDSVADYVDLMKEIYDFDAIRAFFASNPNYNILIDSMHGVTGPYVKRIFIDELKLPASSAMNSVPLEDFGGGHPDPNLTYAHELVERVEKEGINFGAASDGDGDRNMIIGKGVFVNPSDSVAVIASYAKAAIPYFQKTGIKGLARSMPTSASLDRVAKAEGLEIFEVPTAWLSIVAYENKAHAGAGLKDILMKHYKKYGRNFFSRYDYEEVDGNGASSMFAHLEALVTSQKATTIGSKHNEFVVSQCDNFAYTDPIDASISKNQGIRFIFEDGSRIIFRLSGTGSQGATIRLYVEKYSSKPEDFELDTQAGMKTLIDAALKLSKLKEFVGRDEPTVIT
ncbi:Phosphoglucomutase-2 [Dinochytrium kinnereticum]|nr:Phosphoglucomutase-2 [Dinochytrium kinnereticum]